MGTVRENYTPAPVAANGTFSRLGQCELGGFLCTTAGSITVYDAATATGTPIVATMAVTAGVFHPLPFACAVGATVVCSGGAAGTVAHAG